MAKKTFDNVAAVGLAALLTPSAPRAEEHTEPLQKPATAAIETPQKAIAAGRKAILLKVPADTAAQLADAAWKRHTNTTALINDIIAEWLKVNADD